MWTCSALASARDTLLRNKEAGDIPCGEVNETKTGAM